MINHHRRIHLFQECHSCLHSDPKNSQLHYLMFFESSNSSESPNFEQSFWVHFLNDKIHFINVNLITCLCCPIDLVFHNICFCFYIFLFSEDIGFKLVHEITISTCDLIMIIQNTWSNKTSSIFKIQHYTRSMQNCIAKLHCSLVNMPKCVNSNDNFICSESQM